MTEYTGKHHFTMHGNPRDGWTVNVYKFVEDRHFKHLDTISNLWIKPKEFDNLEDAITCLKEVINED